MLLWQLPKDWLTLRHAPDLVSHTRTVSSKLPLICTHVTQHQGAGCMLSSIPAPQLSAAHSTPTATMMQPDMAQ